MMFEESIFRKDLFLDSYEYEEGPLRDRKEKLPNLVTRSTREKEEFIRDVIALTNTGRLFDRPAYMIFGLDNQGIPRDISPDLEPYRKETEVQSREEVLHKFQEAIREYITPVIIVVEVKWGTIEKKTVAYMLIHPHLRIGSHFQVSKTLNTLVAGYWWVRIGESKLLMNPTDPVYYFPATVVPYLLPSIWQKYFSNLLNESDIFRAVNIKNGAYQEPTKTLDAISDFLNNPLEQTLFIRGRAGYGKSLLLRSLVAEWAENGKQAIEAIRFREEFLPPPGWIPIFVPLRNFPDCHTAELLAREILRHANKHCAFWRNTEPASPEILFEYGDLHWLICFDGLDEIWDNCNQQHFLKGLRSFKTRFPLVKHIITTRPDVSEERGLGIRLTMPPLIRTEIERFIKNYAGSGVRESPQNDTSQVVDFSSQDNIEPMVPFADIIAFLDFHPKLWDLCEIPVYLETITEVLTGKTVERLYDIDLETQEKMAGEISAAGGGMVTKISTPKEEIGQSDPLQVAKEELPLILDEPVEQTEKTKENEENGNPQAATQSNYDDDNLPLAFTFGKTIRDTFVNLWEREKGRRSLPIDLLDDWWNDTSDLAFSIAEANWIQKNLIRNSLTAPSDLGDEIGLKWVQSLGVLLRRPSSSYFQFSTYLTHLYFAAQYLEDCILSNDLDEGRSRLGRLSTNLREDCRMILEQIVSIEQTEQLFMEVPNG